MGRHMHVPFCFVYRKFNIPTENLPERHLPDPGAPPARYGGVLQVNQTVQERERDDVIFIHAIRGPLPDRSPGLYGP
jgi:hypothetical protein